MSIDSPPETIGSGSNLSLAPLPALPRTRRSRGLGVMLCEFGYRLARRLINVEIARVLRLNLAAMRAVKLQALDLDYRFLSAPEVRAFAADPANDLDAAMAQRLQSGRDFCFAAIHDGRLANYSWYALDSVEPEHGFGAGLTFPRDTVYMYKAYTLPALRGRQIHGAALQRAMEFFQHRGIRQLIAIVEFANRPSLRSYEKLGCQPAGRLLRIGRRSWGWGCGALLRR
jgi:RimJ/RimL family protein N-acetyltransferase